MRPYQTQNSIEVWFGDLEIGTEFFVCNGVWTGKIIEVNNQKAVYVNETSKTHIIDTNKDNKNEIIISTNKEEKWIDGYDTNFLNDIPY